MAFNFSQNTPTPPLLGYRFAVFFLGAAGLAHPLDFRFQRISGFKMELNNKENLQETQIDPDQPDSFELKHHRLVLERGVPAVSTLRQEIINNLQQGQLIQRNILLSVLDENGLPMLSWMFSKAFAISYEVSGFDAEKDGVLIERIELQYKSVRLFSL